MPLYPRRAAPTPAEPAAPLSLGALLTQVRAALHHRFPDSYWVVAEVADMTRPRHAGGHCYLTLTEPAAGAETLGFTAQARATMWGSRYQQLAPAFTEATGQELRPGLRLLLRVKVTSSTASRSMCWPSTPATPWASWPACAWLPCAA
jgi:exodeoxyribonuclease VII large subunit